MVRDCVHDFQKQTRCKTRALTVFLWRNGLFQIHCFAGFMYIQLFHLSTRRIRALRSTLSNHDPTAARARSESITCRWMSPGGAFRPISIGFGRFCSGDGTVIFILDVQDDVLWHERISSLTLFWLFDELLFGCRRLYYISDDDLGWSFFRPLIQRRSTQQGAEPVPAAQSFIQNHISSPFQIFNHPRMLIFGIL